MQKGLLVDDNKRSGHRGAGDHQQIPHPAGQNVVQSGYWFAFVHQAISVTYANAYGGFGVSTISATTLRRNKCVGYLNPWRRLMRRIFAATAFHRPAAST
jgi:hypothetical protein